MKKIILMSVLLLVVLGAVSLNAQIITTIAGNGTNGYSGDGGLATAAELSGPNGVVVDTLGNVYITDGFNNRLRKLNISTGIITTTDSGLSVPYGPAIDAFGNIYFASGNKILKKNVSTGTLTTIAGNGTIGYSGDGGLATAAELYLNSSGAAAVDALGNVYIVDGSNQRIRKVTASTGIITTIAGNGTVGFSGDGYPATSAQLNITSGNGIGVDTFDNVYFSDRNNNRIRKITVSTGIITTIAGNGTSGYSGDGGPATSAEFFPRGIFVDISSNVYIVDGNGGLSPRIRKVTASTGIISTVAGGATGSILGDDSLATHASFIAPHGVFVNKFGVIYIAEFGERIRKVDTCTARDTTTTVTHVSIRDTVIGSVSISVSIDTTAITGGIYITTDSMHITPHTVDTIKTIDSTVHITNHCTGVTYFDSMYINIESIFVDTYWDTVRVISVDTCTNRDTTKTVTSSFVVDTALISTTWHMVIDTVPITGGVVINTDSMHVFTYSRDSIRTEDSLVHVVGHCNGIVYFDSLYISHDTSVRIYFDTINTIHIDTCVSTDTSHVLSTSILTIDSFVVSTSTIIRTDTIFITGGLVIEKDTLHIKVHGVDSVYTKDSTVSVRGHCTGILLYSHIYVLHDTLSSTYIDTLHGIRMDTCISRDTTHVVTHSWIYDTTSIPTHYVHIDTITITGGLAITKDSMSIITYVIDSVKTTDSTVHVVGHCTGVVYLDSTYVHHDTLVGGYTDTTHFVTPDTVLISTGIEINTVEQIKIYPNPATEIISVETEGKFFVTLSNLMGEKIMNKEGINKISFSLIDLKSGMYFICIQNLNGNIIQNRRIIKE